MDPDSFPVSAKSFYASHREWLGQIDRLALERLAMNLLLKRAADGLNGRIWDAHQHLWFERLIQEALPGCSAPGCGYPDGRPCIKCLRVVNPRPSWVVVYDQHGSPLAAFPNRDLAEAYSENTGWTIQEQPVMF